MKNIRYLIQSFSILILVVLFSCTGGEKKTSQAEASTSVQSKAEPVEINDEAKALLAYLDEMGDYVNTRSFPSLIKAASVYEEMDKNNLIIDLRTPEAFAKGHIKGAKQVEFTQLPGYFTNTIKPFEYDRIILVCYSGQSSSYAASLLRLTGYGNVYSMRWGMSAWNEEPATDSWFEHIASGYQNKLETGSNDKPGTFDFPRMNTGIKDGETILSNRFIALFEAGFPDAIIEAEKVFEQPDKYFIINYDRRDKYEAGHIPGAVRYKPNGTLGIVSEMQTIPNDKEIVIYCGTGHNSGFVTAYLRLFGYDAKTLIYGNNSFMYDKMVTEKGTMSWLPFTKDEIGNYPLVKD
ncbi:rhodanese-like domain-containing protein [Prolixibacteraceae bacterium Z1-6]|uniref:Rhodanese-like domain-containing protein n=1 Tax=Draconibacterium aestuarii TaxID=2998507 RepID=A0A9X3J4N4_9BACT|nr:rhodanese-like domain-containing protein [Prolixibacteraceae bacterium Z1-6]